MKLKLIIVVLLLTLTMIACGADDDMRITGNEIDENTVIEDSMSEEELSEIALAVLEANLVYSETEDIDNYLNTLTSDQNIPSVIEGLEELFDTFDIEYELMDIEILSISPEEAVIQTEQKTVATYISDGYLFNHNIATVTHTLINEDGNYRIRWTELDSDSVVSIDEYGNPIE